MEFRRRWVNVFRSVLCFWQEVEQRQAVLRHAAGPHAVDAYISDPLDSRLIMSLKTYLGQRSFSQTNIFGRTFNLVQLAALLVREVLADQDAGARIVVGRPVHFAGATADDQLGEERLRGAFAAAGFTSIDVVPEPEAAGYQFARSLDSPATILVGDFGGGTSDFSVLRFVPGRPFQMQSLAYGGIGIAGDTFDYRIIDHAVSPLLGKGETYRIMGKELPVPSQYFSGFARWHQLSMMRTPRMLREIEEVARSSADPAKLHRLIRLIRNESGYSLYQAVSAAKAALSQHEVALLRFSDGDFAVERNIARAEFEAWIAADLVRLGRTIDQTLASAGLVPTQIDRVFLTGGSSFIPAVRRLFTDRFGADRVTTGGEFVSVAEGLAVVGRDRIAEGPI